MSSRHSNYINTMMWAFMLLLAAFIIVLLRNRWFCSAKLADEVVPLDVIALLLTSFVTIFLGYYITKKLTESRVEKDSLIEDLKKIESYIYAIQDILKKYDKISIQQITSELNMMILSITRFKNSLEIIEEKKIKTEDLDNHFYQLYTLTTDFEGELAIVEDLLTGRILQASDTVLLDVRRLIHSINIK